MTKSQYENLSSSFRSKTGIRLINVLNKACTSICYAAYPLLLVLLILSHNKDIVKAICVPGFSFILVSVIRTLINFKRPYEVLDIKPIIHKTTLGKSMPSRHVFSVFIIAFTWLYFIPAVGIFLFLDGIVLSAVRVIGGVHYPRDVLVGSLIGIISGYIGFFCF